MVASGKKVGSGKGSGNPVNATPVSDLGTHIQRGCTSLARRQTYPGSADGTLKAVTQRTVKELGNIILIVQPQTVLNWHHELVRWKWSQRQSSLGGRPRTDRVLEALIVHLAKENDWGNLKIAGELMKLGYTVSDETVAAILKRHNIPPLPERKSSLGWRQLMTHYQDQLLACDFFVVETMWGRGR